MVLQSIALDYTYSLSAVSNCGPEHFNSLFSIFTNLLLPTKNRYKYNSLWILSDKAVSLLSLDFDLNLMISSNTSHKKEIFLWIEGRYIPFAHSLFNLDNNGFHYSDYTLQRIRFRRVVNLNINRKENHPILSLVATEMNLFFLHIACTYAEFEWIEIRFGPSKCSK